MDKSEHDRRFPLSTIIEAIGIGHVGCGISRRGACSTAEAGAERDELGHFSPRIGDGREGQDQ